ncbi:Hsp20/alpha crystallin family protein [Streptomyces sp. F001]|uniref:Hsp20/alpha crystallin family protein n=1 Tax=Streptomyces sp. F001 TaxID=1510026 RepID=UPI001F10725A|nr:Hsp20/alpha crystallin family protein [Streptomyces sp. F001]
MDFPVHRTGGSPEAWRRRGLLDWDPLSEFENLWRDMGRLFEQRTAPAWGGGLWVPLVEEDETEDAYEVRAELPGIPRENISVDVGDHELRISGAMKDEDQGRVLSRRSGRFFYRTSLPTDVDADRIEAELNDGVLRIRLPKSGEAKRRRISIGGKG